MGWKNWKIRCLLLAFLWAVQQFMERGLMPDWWPQLSTDYLWLSLGVILTLLGMVIYAETTPYVIRAFRWLFQTAQQITQHYNKRTGVMHFGTKHGDMTVRMDYNEDTIDDINKWLKENDLRAPVSDTAVRETLRSRLQSS